ncbi:MAG: 8-amino-7-oxononanoate synthase [Alphaproteobacteria bacterium]|nr:8-amino-7-oxononanoate synthase [Alphaproteobacteria bacterium]MDE2042665.1 8-amino-7-oxononanoate synthase [Alphaproteobacteria bacterium]MDE2341002.1 8-amino-7-oxononanoate synthase [Alphaproteobacteria bacterium]
MTRFAALHQHLEMLATQGRMRTLAPRAGIDFASNDYLGLAESEELRVVARNALARGVPVGAGGSRLLRGNHPEHEALEAQAALYFGVERALFLANGFVANMALFSTLPQGSDLVLYDELIHASVHEGLRLGRAKSQGVAHNDVGALEAAIKDWRANVGMGKVWIAVESLYSMDGDFAPLEALVALADAHEAVLVIDEAHATGVFGADGVGLAEEYEGRDNIITLHTLGKACGCEGALVCGPAIVADMLINRARGFIFSTAPSPLMAAVARGALDLLTTSQERQFRLAAMIAHAQQVIPARLGLVASESQIQPIVVGDNARAMQLAAACQHEGFDVRGIRPPTVPEGTARLRLSLTLNATAAEFDALIDLLAGLL